MKPPSQDPSANATRPDADATREAAEMYRLIVENARELGMFMVDLDGRIMSWNPGAERITGFAEDDVMEEPLSMLFGPEDREAGIPERELETAARAGQAPDKRWHVRKDGSRFWANGVMVALHDAEGRLRGFAKLMQDETELKRAEDALRESEERHRLALEAGEVGVWELDLRTRRFRVRSPRHDRIFGYEAPVPDWSLNEFLAHLHPEDRPWIVADFESALGAGEWNFEARILRTDGETRWISVRAELPESDEGLIRAVGTIQDVTVRKRREANTAFLDDVGEVFSRLSAPDDIMQQVGPAASAHLGVTFCLFADIDQESRTVSVAYHWHHPDLPPLPESLPLEAMLGESLGREEVRAGEPFVVRDAATDPRVDSETCARLHLRSCVFVPFRRHGDWRFLLALCGPDAREWRTDEIEVARELAQRLFPRLERARAEEALRESEEKYRTLFNSIDEGFCMLEPVRDEHGSLRDLRFTDVNPAVRKQTGVDVPVGGRLRELLPEFDPRWFERYAKVLETGEPIRFQDYEEAMERWFDVYVFRVGSTENPRVALIFQDISSRKASEAEVQAAAGRDRFRIALADALRTVAQPRDAAAVGIRLLGEHLEAERVSYTEHDRSRDQTVVEASYSPASGGLSRGSPSGGSPSGGSPSGGSPSEDAQATPPLATQELNALRRGRIVATETRRSAPHAPRSGDPDECAEPARIVVPIVRSGRLAAHLEVRAEAGRTWTDQEVALVRETSERIWATMEQARTDEALREAMKRAKAGSDAKSRFLATMSHELRTPLTSVIGYSDLLEQGVLGPVTPRQREKLARVGESARHLVSMIDEILVFARAEAGREEVLLEDVDLVRIVDEVAALVRQQAAEKGLSLTVVGPQEPVHLSTDPGKVRRILLNLAGNAVHYTEEGGVWIEVDPSGRETVLVRVRDTGPGIEPADGQRVFEAFTQLTPPGIPGTAGSGLGLAITRRLARILAGEVTLESTPGEGSTFTLHLPRSRPAVTG